MMGFFEAVQRSGGTTESITAAKAALEQFNAFVQVHAGSRTAFNSIIRGLRGTGLETVDLTNRRAMFTGQSHFLGVEADVNLACFAFKPSDSDDGLIDAAGVRGVIGLRRYRRDVGWVISSIRATDDDTTPRRFKGPEPLVPSEQHPEVGLLPEFCSAPLPELQYLHTERGSIEVEIQPSGLGATSATTCLIGHVFRGAFARYQDEHNSYQHCQATVRTPCRVLIMDMLLHRDLVRDTTPDLLVYTDHRDGDPAIHGRDRDLLASRDSVEHLGQGPTVLATPDVPRYEQMGRFMLDRLDWNGDEFDAYRCRIEYPLMPSSVLLRFGLPVGTK